MLDGTFVVKARREVVPRDGSHQPADVLPLNVAAIVVTPVADRYAIDRVAYQRGVGALMRRTYVTNLGEANQVRWSWSYRGSSIVLREATRLYATAQASPVFALTKGAKYSRKPEHLLSRLGLRLLARDNKARRSESRPKRAGCRFRFRT
jgi:hypothetical protein